MSWPMVKLGDIAVHLRNGVSIKQNDADGGIPITRIETIAQREVNFDKCGYAGLGVDDYPDYRLAKGDILISHINSEKHLGKCAIFTSEREDVVHGMNLLCFRVKESVFPKFVFYYLSSEIFLSKLPNITKKSVNQASFTVTSFKELEIPLPPLAEQKRIAAILDKADAIRRKRQQAIQLADDFLRAVFLEMFGDPVANPKGWEVRPVGDIVGCIVPGRDKPKSFTGETPWITTNDLAHLHITTISKKSMGLSPSEIDNVSARVIPKGSVLMTCVGDLGVLSLAGNDLVMNQQLHAFLVNDSIVGEFLMYALSFQKDYMIKMASSTTVPYMNKSVCNSIPLFIPPYDLQMKFKALYREAVTFKSRLGDFDQQCDALFCASSQKAFSGQL